MGCRPSVAQEQLICECRSFQSSYHQDDRIGARGCGDEEHSDQHTLQDTNFQDEDVRFSVLPWSVRD